MNAIYIQALRETNEELDEGTVGGMVAGAGMLAAGYGLYKGGKTLVKGTKQIGRDMADLGKAGANKIDERMNKVRDYNARQETLRKARLSPEEREARIRAEERNKRLAGYVAAGTGAYLLARHHYKKNEGVEDNTPLVGEELDEGIGQNIKDGAKHTLHGTGAAVASGAMDSVMAKLSGAMPQIQSTVNTTTSNAVTSAYNSLKQNVAGDLPAIKNMGMKAAAGIGAAYVGKKMLDNHFAKRQELLRVRAREQEERRQAEINRKRQQKIEDEEQRREERMLRHQAKMAVAEAANCNNQQPSTAASVAGTVIPILATGGAIAYGYYKKKKAEQEAIKADEEARRKAQEAADNARVDKRIKNLVDRARDDKKKPANENAIAVWRLAEAAGVLSEDAKSDYQANMDALRAKYTGLGVQSARKVLGDFKASNPEGYKELRTLAVKEAGHYAVRNTVPAIKDAIDVRRQYHRDRRAEKRAARNESAELTLFKETVDRAMNV